MVLDSSAASFSTLHVAIPTLSVPKLNLEWLLQHESYKVCPFLTADDFVAFCRDRGLDVDKKALERYEELRVFFPIARLQIGSTDNIRLMTRYCG